MQESNPSRPDNQEPYIGKGINLDFTDTNVIKVAYEIGHLEAFKHAGFDIKFKVQVQ